MFALVALGTLDVIVVGSQVSPAAAAAYFPANRIALLAGFASLPIQLVVEQKFASLLARGEVAGAQQAANSATALLLISCISLGFVLLAGYPIYQPLFPTATPETFWALFILVTGTVVGSLCGMAGSILLMSDHQAAFARTNIACACLAAAMLVIFTQGGSLVAVAMVVAGVEVLRKAVLAYVAYRFTGIMPFRPSRL